MRCYSRGHHIGIRSYPIQEIEGILGRNGLGFFNPIASELKDNDLPDPLIHRFHLSQKIGSTRPVATVDWAELELPHFVSDLDNRFYDVYADDCIRTCNYQEVIHALQTLLKKNPDYIAEWLKLAAVFIETTQLQQTLGALKWLTNIHHRYQEGQITFQNLLKKCASQRSAFFTPLPTN